MRIPTAIPSAPAERVRATRGVDRTVKIVQPAPGGGERVRALREQRGGEVVGERGQRAGVGCKAMQQAEAGLSRYET
ncbi:MAG: hypothetical protein EBZ55_06955, partial [Actinobacteria bacterium]|nr:hypothetical protein [Actinomycetota bacterium]